MKQISIIPVLLVLAFLCVDVSVGQDVARLAEDASEAERLQWSRELTRQLTEAVSDTYRTEKVALDRRWSNGEIDRLAREELFAQLNAATASTRQRIRDAGHDELLELARVILVEPGSVADSVLESATDSPVDMQFCNCMKTRYRSADELQHCQQEFGQIDEQLRNEHVRACRTADVTDPFADALSRCSAFQDSYLHPFTGSEQHRSLTSVSTGACQYSETLPGDSRLECQWQPQAWNEMSDYFRHAEYFADARMTSSTEFVNGSAVTVTLYEVDGQPWHNPMQASMDDGRCQIVR